MTASFPCAYLPVHPRVRGEQLCAPAFSHKGSGSSPRARGAGEEFWPVRLDPRFIPACAGSRTLFAPSVANPAVHPRVRGEQFKSTGPTENSGGSSPRARGAASLNSRPVAISGFIPACAGSRATSAGRAANHAVHPRVRGEQARAGASSPYWVGSSPRARGAGSAIADVTEMRRFIPACAGSSRCWATGR